MPQNDIEYFLEPLIFRVEDTLFRVPQEYLSQESPVFLDMLQLGRPIAGGEGAGSEGSADSAPIILHGTITARSFRALLQVLYPRDPFTDAILTKDEWLLVLELSKMWDMNRVRNAAINHLVPDLEDDPAHKLSLAKTYDIHDWKQPALEKLIRREQSLGDREYQMLDQETLIKIARIRELCYPILRDSDESRYGWNGNEGISHWELREERKPEVSTNLDLTSFNFTCPSPPQLDSEEPINLDDGQESIRRNGEFFFEKIVFKVDNELYKVPNQPFAQHSSTLRHRFASRAFRKYDHQDPFLVEADVEKSDFEALLRFFFPKTVCNKELSSEEWASILRLTAKWKMEDVKSMAVQKLEHLDFGSPAMKLRMAQELGVQEWYSSAMKALISRHQALGTIEYQVLSQEHLLQVLNLRERAHHRYSYNYGSITQLRTSRGEVPTDIDLSQRLANFV